MITIVDYGLGNLLAFINVYKRLNIQVATARNVEELHSASKLILPGVGAFDHAMILLEQSGMRETLDALVMDKSVPVLGVCVGMQMLSHSSEEGRARGLGWINGQVKSLRGLRRNDVMLPHMGWNDVRPASQSRLFKHLESDARFYFLHSYYFCCDHEGDIAAVTNYGVNFSSAVNAGNIYGVQFHPEKSHHFGAQLLKNFAEL